MDFSKVGYCTVDAETTVKCPPTISNNKALPSYPENKIVMLGAMNELLTTSHSSPLSVFTEMSTSTKLVVGHNLPFDLQYMKKQLPVAYTDIVTRCKIWDTSIAEYCMSAQERLYPSLDELAEQYGGFKKKGDFKEFWDKGGQTEDIDPKELKEYLKGDLENTTTVFKKQFEECATNNRQLTKLILSQGNTALALADIMYNGMAIDYQELHRQRDEATARLADLKRNIENYIKGCCLPTNFWDHVDIDSASFMSKVFFGGTIKYKDKEPAGFYKNGKPKTKVVEKEQPVLPLGNLHPSCKVPNAHGFSVDEGVLKQIVATSKGTAVCSVATSLLEYRKIMKDLNTYIIPVMTKSFETDGFLSLHGNVNNVSTQTGRMSSNDPNLQNLTSKEKSEVKKGFISRWNNDGWFVEADYKQLEIVALAYLTKSKQLKQDINDGKDIHTELYKQMYGGRTPSDEERKNFKRRSFALIYGASATSIAEQCNCSLAEAKTFMKVFHTRYPEVGLYRTMVLDLCHKYGVDDGFDKETSLPRKAYVFRTPTGRLLKFRQYYVDFKKRVDYSPTQVANYPIQSFATADIVQTVLGVLFRKIYLNERLRDKCLIINTVHDSIEFDIHNDVLEEATNLIEEVMSDVSGTLSSIYDINDFDVKVVVNMTKGRNWFDQEPI